MHHHPQRKHPRLRGYDYRTPGRYFVTTVTAGRKMLFGRVVGGEMRLGEMGRIVDEEWRRTAEVRPDVQIDALVVMPNHVHAIITITADAHPDTIVGAQRAAPAPRPGSDDVERPVVAPGSLGAIVRAAKSASSRRINELRGTPGAPVWQRGFWDRIIRDDEANRRIRAYIRDNPRRWHKDVHRPRAIDGNPHPEPADSSESERLRCVAHIGYIASCTPLGGKYGKDSDRSRADGAGGKG
jgi:putative transposase